MANCKEILTLAVEIGDTLLRSGGEIYRVEDTILNILETFEVEDYDVYVLSNGIFASANEDKEDACSVIRHVPLGAVNLNKIAAINQLSREICSHSLDVEEAWEKLKACRQMPRPKAFVLLLSCGTGCGCFCYIFGGSVLDSLFAFLMGVLLEAFTLKVAKRTSKFIVNILGSALVTAGSLLIFSTGLTVLQDKIVIGSIMPLVPGIVMTNSIRDLFNGDYLSGAIHLLDALLTAMCIAVGVGSVIIFYRSLTGGVLLP